MIPLRILHAVPPAGSLEYLAIEPLLQALVAAGQMVAMLHRIEAEPATAPATMPAFHGIPCDPRWFPWWSGGRKKTARAVALWTPDLIHVHSSSLLPVALDLSRDLNLGIIVSTVSHEDAHAARRLRDPRITWILVPTEEHRVHLARRVGIHRDRIAVVPPGARVPTTGPSCRIGAGWRIGTVAGRNHHAFITAIRDLQSGGLPVEGVVHTRLLPVKSRDRLLAELNERSDAFSLIDGPFLELLDQLDVLVITEANDLAIPLIVAAQVAGIPVVTVPAPGVAELIHDGVTGVLLGNDSPATLTDTLCALHDRERRSELATASLVQAGRRFNASIIAEATLALYRSCLGETDSGIKAEVSRTWRRLTDLHLQRR